MNITNLGFVRLKSRLFKESRKCCRGWTSVVGRIREVRTRQVIYYSHSLLTLVNPYTRQTFWTGQAIPPCFLQGALLYGAPIEGSKQFGSGDSRTDVPRQGTWRKVRKGRITLVNLIHILKELLIIALDENSAVQLNYHVDNWIVHAGSIQSCRLLLEGPDSKSKLKVGF